MNKKLLTWLLAAGIAVVFVATGLQAGTEVPDTIKMDYNNYTKRVKAPPKFKFIEFTHKKHNEEFKISCGDCHHDKDKKPLDLKIGDNVQKCVECHTKLEKDKKDKNDPLVLENAMHGNCVDCHKDVNKKAGDPKGMKGPAPASCNKCHEKGE
ncbi:MAG: cytochrome c family protein [Proteobacteria bacterium]|nr:cytochrome c family protein [Pseudomonadota bacterium]MBU1581620.1 cytochrome c family protein [Pseudomonadota bacterium]MBU2454083.1 cytochrome c family protein [Pseudomonadota bacterium]MBU2631923.1 cytochrome c family protein [Pseudomonadota bacterium]